MAQEDEREALEKLLVDQKSLIKRLAEAAKGLVGIDGSTGEPLILETEANLGDKSRIFLLLLGRYLSFKLGKCESDSLANIDLAQKLGLKPNVCRGRLSDLKKDGIIEPTLNGEHRIVYANAPKTLTEIKSKIKG